MDSQAYESSSSSVKLENASVTSSELEKLTKYYNLEHTPVYLPHGSTHAFNKKCGTRQQTFTDVRVEESEISTKECLRTQSCSRSSNSISTPSGCPPGSNTLKSHVLSLSSSQLRSYSPPKREAECATDNSANSTSVLEQDQSRKIVLEKNPSRLNIQDELFTDIASIYFPEIKDSESSTMPTNQLYSRVNAFENGKLDFLTNESDLPKPQIRKDLISFIHSSLAKDETVASLKSKVADLYADVESLKYSHSQAQDAKAELEEECSSLKKSISLFYEQLESSKSSRCALKQEVDRIRSLMENTDSQNHLLVHENSCLQAQLACSRASLCEAKRNLSKQLECIRNDLIEREAMFEKIVSERTSFEILNRQRTNELSECNQKIISLRDELANSEAEVFSLVAKCEQSRNSIETLEQAKIVLLGKISALEDEISRHSGAYQDINLQYQEACNHIKQLKEERKLDEANTALVLEEKAALVVALDAAGKDKEALNLSISSLSGDMVRVEQKIFSMKKELSDRSSRLAFLESTNEDLKNDLKTASDRLEEMSAQFEGALRDKDILQTTLKTLTEENNGLKDDIVRLSLVLEAAQSAIQPACIEASEAAQRGMKEQLDIMKNGLNLKESHLNDLKKQIEVLLLEQQKYANLIHEHSELQANFDRLSLEYLQACENASSKHAHMVQQLDEFKLNTQQVLKEKSSEIKILSSQNESFKKEVFRLKDELSLLEASNASALASEWSDKLIKSEAERCEIEAKLTESRQKIFDISAQYSNEVANLQSEIVRLESRSHSLAELEIKQSCLVARLSDARRREASLLNSLAQLRRVGLADSFTSKIGPMPDKVEDLHSLIHWSPDHSLLSLKAKPLGLTSAHSSTDSLSVSSEMNRIMDERDSMAEAASTASHEAAIAIANLVLMQQELHQVSKKLDYEANASKCSNDARLAAIGKLNEAHLELASLRELITKTQQERDDASKCAKDLSDQLVFNIKSHSSERHALKETIKILTDYLSSVSSEFETSLKAKLQSEKELALCRGGIRGLVDRYRFFSHLDNYEKDCMTSTNLSKEVNQTTTSSTGLTLIDLEGLLEESDDHPLVQSKETFVCIKVYEEKIRRLILPEGDD